MLHGIVKI